MRVDFPEPDGPMIDTNSPGSRSTLTPRSACTLTSPILVNLGQVTHSDDGHIDPLCTLPLIGYRRGPRCGISGEPLLPLGGAGPLSGVETLVTSCVPA